MSSVEQVRRDVFPRVLVLSPPPDRSLGTHPTLTATQWQRPSCQAPHGWPYECVLDNVTSLVCASLPQCPSHLPRDAALTAFAALLLKLCPALNGLATLYLSLRPFGRTTTKQSISRCRPFPSESLLARARAHDTSLGPGDWRARCLLCAPQGKIPVSRPPKQRVAATPGGVQLKGRRGRGSWVLSIGRRTGLDSFLAKSERELNRPVARARPRTRRQAGRGLADWKRASIAASR